MSLEVARNFFSTVKSDELFYRNLSSAESPAQRLCLIKSEGFDFTKEEFETAKAELSDWDLTMIEDESSFRSDKRVSGLEFCCCCGVAGSVKEN